MEPTFKTSRIQELFKKKQNRILNVYATAGFPQMDSTLQILKALEESGADIVELGMPYSDPLADGPIIQESSSKALHNGMTIKKLFEQLKGFRSSIQIPVILMGYMNPVLQYGFEKFCAEAAAVGIDGLIIPDLPEYEYEKEYKAIISSHGLDFIFLITPETVADRVKKLDELSTGFLYAVSSSSTTGNQKNDTDIAGYLERIRNMKLRNPVLVGFGIRDKASFDQASRFVQGAIIGSAYIKALGTNPDIESVTHSFVNGIIH